MAAVQGLMYDMSSSNGPVSRLTELQARFQQKQLQEKEQKLLALYDKQTRQAYQRIGPGGGKVRQLFQDRRGQNHHPGWDRSYPLDPILDNRRERGTSLDRNLNNVWKQPVRRTRSQARKDHDELPSSRSYEPLDQLVFKYNSPVFGDENDYLSRVNDLESSRIFRKLPNIGGATLSDSSDRFKTYIATKQPTASMAPAKEQKPQARVADVGSVTKAMARMSPPSKKPEVKPAVPIANNRARTSTTPPAASIKQRTTVTPPTKLPSRPSSDTAASEPDKMNRRQPINKPLAPRSVTPVTKAQTPRGPQVGGRSDLVSCKICSRNFAPDRIQAHVDICTKTSRKKRKPFDVSKQRVRGTELESFAKKGRPSQPPPKTSVQNNKMLQPLTKSNWRRKHEEFIANIRAAKQAQAHVAKGGKLSDLPPPPPMDTSDLIPCPHCNRKFNQAAAERHIPKCATMLHNKPKPGGAAKPKTTRRY